jgi:hypothetical protein
MKRRWAFFALPLAFVLTTVQAQRNTSDLQAQAKNVLAQINGTIHVRGFRLVRVRALIEKRLKAASRD